MASRKKNDGLGYRDRVILKERFNPYYDIPQIDKDNPFTLVEVLQDVIVSYLEEGNPYDVVCDLVGISKETYHNWIRKGEKYEADILEGKEIASDERFYRFILATRKASALWLRERVLRLNSKFTPTGWQKDLLLLERRDWQNWGKKKEFVTQSDEVYSDDDAFL